AGAQAAAGWQEGHARRRRHLPRAAVEQLQVWGERNRIPVIAQHTGADSASVIYDAVQAAQARGVDVLIADTAGRLHTKDNLMEELKKVRRVIGKLDDTAPHEVLLVLD